MKIEEQLNSITQNKYNFVLKSAELDSEADVCYLLFFYNDGTILTSEARSACKQYIENTLPDCYTYDIKFVKNYVESGSLTELINNYFKTNHPSIKYTITSINADEASVTIDILALQQAYCTAGRLQETLAEAIEQAYNQKFKVKFTYSSQQIGSDIEDAMFDVPISAYVPSSKTIVVTNKTPIIGEHIACDATYIRDSLRVGNNAILCGKLKDCAIRFTKPKKIPEGQTEQQVIDYFASDNVPLAERYEAGQKPIFKFKLEDFTGEVAGNYYIGKEQYAIFAGLVADVPAGIIMQGAIVENKFSGAINFKPTNISSCTLPEVWEEEIDYLAEKPYYEFVKPEPIVSTNQVGLFNFGAEVKVASYLAKNQVVVFDFETTGLNPYQGDKIIEIGAVKLVNGAMVEQFRTLVNPGMPIPPDSTKVHHLTDEDVADAPTAKQALQDFYKFTRGCVLSGYNIVGFDCNFLSVQGKAAKYNFDNPTIDVYPLAQRCIKGTKNYKLKTIAKHLGVNLDNAHSALYDTIATAEVLIKLAENITQ